MSLRVVEQSFHMRPNSFRCEQFFIIICKSANYFILCGNDIEPTHINNKYSNLIRSFLFGQTKIIQNKEFYVFLLHA